MIAKLIKVIRDKDGLYHRPNEQLEILSEMSRAGFDSTRLIQVKFSDGHLGVVYPSEIER
jgi:hypothetical protein